MRRRFMTSKEREKDTIELVFTWCYKWTQPHVRSLLLILTFFLWTMRSKKSANIKLVNFLHEMSQIFPKRNHSTNVNLWERRHRLWHSVNCVTNQEVLFHSVKLKCETTENSTALFRFVKSVDNNYFTAKFNEWVFEKCV